MSRSRAPHAHGPDTAGRKPPAGRNPTLTDTTAVANLCAPPASARHAPAEPRRHETTSRSRAPHAHGPDTAGRKPTTGRTSRLDTQGGSMLRVHDLPARPRHAPAASRRSHEDVAILCTPPAQSRCGPSEPQARPHRSLTTNAPVATRVAHACRPGRPGRVAMSCSADTVLRRHSAPPALLRRHPDATRLPHLERR